MKKDSLICFGIEDSIGKALRQMLGAEFDFLCGIAEPKKKRRFEHYDYIFVDHSHCSKQMICEMVAAYPHARFFVLLPTQQSENISFFLNCGVDLVIEKSMDLAELVARILAVRRRLTNYAI